MPAELAEAVVDGAAVVGANVGAAVVGARVGVAVVGVNVGVAVVGVNVGVAVGARVGAGVPHENV